MKVNNFFELRMNESEMNPLFTLPIWELWMVNYSSRCFHFHGTLLYIPIIDLIEIQISLLLCSCHPLLCHRLEAGRRIIELLLLHYIKSSVVATLCPFTRVKYNLYKIVLSITIGDLLRFVYCFFGRLVVSSLLFLIMIKTIGGLNL